MPCTRDTVVVGKVWVLAGLALFFNLLDNLTTYLCLRETIPGYQIVELNPIADWIFKAIGLGPGLIFEYAITLVAVAFLAKTSVLSLRVKLIVLGLLALLAASAGVNNLIVMSKIGLLGV